jgi:hypothetical protein
MTRLLSSINKKARRKGEASLVRPANLKLVAVPKSIYLFTHGSCDNDRHGESRAARAQ